MFARRFGVKSAFFKGFGLEKRAGKRHSGGLKMSISLYQKFLDEISGSLKELVGIYNSSGVITACTDKDLIGKKIAKAEFRHLSYELDFDKTDKYTLFTEADTDRKTAGIFMASLKAFKAANREFDDEEYFFQQLINAKVENRAWKAQCLGIEDEVLRVVFVIKVTNKNIVDAMTIIRAVAPVREGDHLFPNETGELVFVRNCKTEPSNSKLTGIASLISTGLSNELMEQPSIGIGCISTKLETVSESYITAKAALDVGETFESRSRIYSHMNLGISRLVTAIPIHKCKTFLSEVLSDDVLHELDNDTINTVQKFFDYDLNISLAARELYIHRNTLVYRLDRVQALTGLDVRKFDDALLFKIALLIQKHLKASRR